MSQLPTGCPIETDIDGEGWVEVGPTTNKMQSTIAKNKHVQTVSDVNRHCNNSDNKSVQTDSDVMSIDVLQLVVLDKPVQTENIAFPDCNIVFKDKAVQTADGDDEENKEAKQQRPLDECVAIYKEKVTIISVYVFLFNNVCNIQLGKLVQLWTERILWEVLSTFKCKIASRLG